MVGDPSDLITAPPSIADQGKITGDHRCVPQIRPGDSASAWRSFAVPGTI